MSTKSWKEPLPLVTQAIRLIPIFFISVVILSTALLVTHARMPDPKVARPLPDIGFEMFSKIAWLSHVADLCIVILNVISALVCFKLYLLHRRYHHMEEMNFPLKVAFLKRFFMSVWDNNADCNISHSDIHLIAWIRFLSTYIFLLLCRVVVIIVTSYPATDNQCQNPKPVTEPVKNVIVTVLTLGSASNHCGDLMFSGHTIILTLNLVLQWIYGKLLHSVFRPISVVLVLFAFYCIIASRSHYTDDIVVSFLLTAVTFIAVGHTERGAPWQLQLVFRWWPCCGSNEREPPTVNHLEVVVEEDEAKV